MATTQTDRIAFGLFEVDLQAGELWKGSYKVRLAGQPFVVLTTLLARPGEVDGRWIAALSLNQKTLMIYDVAQQHWRELAETSAADPCWSADSKSLYVHAFLEEHQPILQFGIPKGERHVVADLSGFHDQATINYFFGGVTPTAQPLVQPRIGAGDLYALEFQSR